MKVFHCDHCRARIYFENVVCLACGHALAFLPDIFDMAAVEATDDGRWRSLAPGASANRYRLCDNYVHHAVCNWAVPDDETEALCRSCRLTTVVPNLDQPGSIEAWAKLEVAKRRLVYTLMELGLPLVTRDEATGRGVAFEFLTDDPDPKTPNVLTGHDEGRITINTAEADDVEREKRRIAMHEPYRTLLGHFRHEIGHYYWDRLILHSDRLDAFRALFGDERADYAEALRHHYDNGPLPDWQDRHVSSYASTHPWEDWAETWAHYLHMFDTLQTAEACKVTVEEPQPPTVSRRAPASTAPTMSTAAPFDETIERWISLARALNDLNRSLGLPDGYPFVLAVPAIEKLRFIHETIQLPAPEEPGLTSVAPPNDGADRVADASANAPPVASRAPAASA